MGSLGGDSEKVRIHLPHGEMATLQLLHSQDFFAWDVFQATGTQTKELAICDAATITSMLPGAHQGF